MTARPARHDASARSPFTGQYVHELLGLALSAPGPRPVFDDDRWDLRGAQGAPIQVNPGELDWDFTEIPRPHALWRIVLTRMSAHPPTLIYVERRTKEGLSKKEIIRCLKRYVAREVYHHLRATG